MEREIVEKDLRFHELFGYIPATFCIEVKTIMFNEFQEAARIIKDKLIKVILITPVISMLVLLKFFNIIDRLIPV